MPSLLADVVEHLHERDIETALIERSASERNVLTMDHRVLGHGTWAHFESAEVGTRAGGKEDPFAGLVRIRRGEERVNLIVGKRFTEREAIESAEFENVGDVSVRVLSAADAEEIAPRVRAEIERGD